jgi:hypothetical protein
MLGNRVLGQCPGCVGTGTARLRTLSLAVSVSLYIQYRSRAVIYAYP